MRDKMIPLSGVLCTLGFHPDSAGPRRKRRLIVARGRDAGQGDGLR